MRRPFLFAAFSLFATAPSAQMLNAADFLPGCRAALQIQVPADRSAVLKMGQCLGVVHAIITLVRDLPPATGFCPKEASMGELLNVLLNYVDGRPELLNDNFVHVSVQAFRATWPCN